MVSKSKFCLHGLAIGELHICVQSTEYESLEKTSATFGIIQFPNNFYQLTPDNSTPYHFYHLSYIK
jgi:hypothetical protein